MACGSTPSSPEAELTRTAKYAIFASQMIAYLPLSVVNRTLVMKHLSITFILQTLFNILLVASSVIMAAFILLGSNINYTPDNSFTEGIVMSVVAAIGWIYCVCCRLRGYWKKTTTREFWLRNVELLTRFLRTSSGAVDSQLLDNMLAKIRVSLRNSALTFILLVTCVAVVVPLRISFNANLSEVDVLIIYAETCNNVLICLHTGHGIWVCFFLKVYTVLFQVIGSKLGSLGSFLDGDAQPVALSLDELKDIVGDCYNLYLRLEDQIKDFNHHFGTFLVWDSLFGLLHIVYFMFLVHTSGLKFDIPSIGVFGFGLVIFSRNLYVQGTEGSRLTGAGGGVLDNLHKLYATRRPTLDFGLRQDLQIFMALITTNMPKVDAAQYFVLNRNMVKAVTKR